MSKLSGYRAVWLPLLFFPLSGAVAAEFTAQDITDAILGKKTFSDSVLNSMDINLDGKVDVSDLIQADKRPKDQPFAGYQWIVTASYSSDTGNKIPLNYAFVLNIQPSPTPTVTGTLTDFDPTKILLKQGVRFPYFLTKVIPAGIKFSLNENGSTATLVSEPVSIVADNPTNPTGKALTRTWKLVIDKASLATGSASNGSITETISGFLPNAKNIQSNGSISMTVVAKLTP